MFQISRRADYAVRIMIELGVHEATQLMPTRVIAQKTGVPKAFLHKIANDLARSGLVRTVSVPAGGVGLAQPAQAITMLNILEAVEGPVCVNVCQVRPQDCPRTLICPGHDFFGELQASILGQLRSRTLADLVAQAERLRRTPRVRVQDEVSIG